MGAGGTVQFPSSRPRKVDHLNSSTHRRTSETQNAGMLIDRPIRKESRKSRSSNQTNGDNQEESSSITNRYAQFPRSLSCSEPALCLFNFLQLRQKSTPTKDGFSHRTGKARGGSARITASDPRSLFVESDPKCAATKLAFLLELATSVISLTHRRM
jgi:hypothetical protein